MIESHSQRASAIRVLHVDDDPSLTDLTADLLDKDGQVFEVITENSPPEALDRLEQASIDCIVSDYEMPEMDGLEFLEEVRERDRNVPFILFTGKGSEEIASEAISRGVTDYLQKGTGVDQYTVLANRIENTVSQARAEQEVEHRSKWYSRILRHSSDYVLIVNEQGNVRYVSPAIERVMGYTPAEVEGNEAFQFVHPDDLEYAANAFADLVEAPDREVTVEFRSEASDGSVHWLEVRGRNFMQDDLIQGILVNVRDITERKHREQELERQNERLDEFTQVITHDLRNPLSVVDMRVDLANQRFDSEHLEAAAAAVRRIEALLEDVETLAREGQEVTDPQRVEIADVARASWGTVQTDDASLEVPASQTVLADESRLRQVFENLMNNAVQHGGPAVTVTVGDLPDGFYIDDDGPGVPDELVDHIFEPGYSTDSEGTGLGLQIVCQIVENHDWEISLVESETGGARFEITGVDPVDTAR